MQNFGIFRFPQKGHLQFPSLAQAFPIDYRRYT
jgi:hypothetical protein